MPGTPLAAPFHRAVLGLNGGATDPLVVKLGCELARSFKATVVALHIVEVDWTHDLADDIASGNELAASVLDMAEGIAEKYGITLETHLIQARDIGPALVDEAAELEADTILLGLPYRKRFGGDFAIGRTVPYVLENASAGVIIVREPIPATEAQALPPALAGTTSGPAS